MYTSTHTITANANEFNQQVPASLIDVEALFHAHSRYLKHFVLRIVRNEEIAQELVQDTYIEAIKSAGSFKGQSQVKTWLIGIALNLSRSHNRKLYKYTPQQISDEALAIIPDQQQAPDDLLQNQQMLNATIQHLASMPKNMRSTAYLVLCEEMSYEHAASIMQVPIGTIRSRVSRARKMLEALAA